MNGGRRIVWLYEEDNPYEVVRHYAVIGDSWIEMHGDTSEKAPGSRYTSMNKVEGADFIRLLEELDVDVAELAQKIEREFSGEGGLMAFRRFCIERDVDMACYIG